MPEEENNQISKYNDANLSILRLHEHWIDAENYANSGQLIKWKFKLDSVLRELAHDIRRNTQYKKIIKYDNELRDNINKSKSKNELYSNLHKRHKFLKIIQDRAGKAGVYVDKDTEDFE